jgi:hypothetical protein
MFLRSPPLMAQQTSPSAKAREKDPKDSQAKGSIVKIANVK